MEFSILGPLEVRAEGQALSTGAGKEWALLALLLLNADRVVPVDRIVDELWGERVPGSAQKMVQIYVSQLRKQLPEGLIQTRAPGYRLALGEHVLDLRRFEQLAADGGEALRLGRATEAAQTLREALALWRGAALGEFSEPFAEVEGARLEEQQLACLEGRIDADLASGRHHELVAEVEALVRRHPLRERPRSQLMLALYRAGRHAEALDAYHSFRRLLDEELGIEPPEALKELERRILRQDASLALPTAAASAPVAAGVAPAAPLAPAVAEWPLGRDRELARLEQLLVEASEGERRLVFVTGEAGIGKTTIVESFIASAAGAELLIGHGQCVEHRGAGEPYLPLLDALGRLCRQHGGEAVREALARLAPTWLVQLPSLVPDDERRDLEWRLAGATHERMLRELLDTLDELAARRTVLLVLEDLHWSDPSTLDLLDALAYRREPARLLVIGTYRRADALARPQSVHELEQTLRARGLCTELAVGALDEAALEAYLVRRLSTPVPRAGLAGLLRERTGGKPLFATMLLESWLERGLIGHDGAPVDVEVLAADVPDSVRDLTSSCAAGWTRATQPCSAPRAWPDGASRPRPSPPRSSATRTKSRAGWMCSRARGSSSTRSAWRNGPTGRWRRGTRSATTCRPRCCTDCCRRGSVRGCTRALDVDSRPRSRLMQARPRSSRRISCARASLQRRFRTSPGRPSRRCGGTPIARRQPT